MERRAVVIKGIVALEKKGVKPAVDDPGNSLDAEALSLLADLESAAPKRAASPGAQLAAFFHERDVIDRALAIGRIRLAQAYADRVQAMLDAGAGNDWRELLRQTAIVVAQLQELNRRRRDLRATLSAGAGVPILPCDGFRLLGVGEPSSDRGADEANRYLEAAVAAGIITKRELDI